MDNALVNVTVIAVASAVVLRKQILHAVEKLEFTEAAPKVCQFICSSTAALRWL